MDASTERTEPPVAELHAGVPASAGPLVTQFGVAACVWLPTQQLERSLHGRVELPGPLPIA